MTRSGSWEEFVARRPWFGVFACEADGSEGPRALFPHRADAERFVKWQTEELPEDDRTNIELCVCEVHNLDGRIWNSYEPAPQVPNLRKATCERCKDVAAARRATATGPRVICVWVLGHAYEPDDQTITLCSLTSDTAVPGAVPRANHSLPGFWRNETSGVLRPVVERYLAGEQLDHQEVATMRAYLRQWVGHDGFRGAAVESLRNTIDKITDNESLAEWLVDALDAGVDPL